MSNAPYNFYTPDTPSSVLYVEDEPDDVLFMRRAYKRSGLTHVLRVTVQGQEAIDYLAGVPPFDNRQEYPIPCLVLLDLNLPIKTGFEVLVWIRQQPQFKTLPVIIYSASSQERDKRQAMELGASEYIVKLPTPTEISRILQALDQRWLTPQPKSTAFM